MKKKNLIDRIPASVFAALALVVAVGLGAALNAWASTVDPNMGFTNPEVGDAGTGYATNLRNSLTTIGAHDHTTGKGAKVPSAGINVNADIEWNGNDLLEARTIRFDTAAVTIAASDRRAIYQTGGELAYVDESGNVTTITNNGSVAGASGTITGMTGSASVVYSPLTNTFAFTDDAGAPARQDYGCIRIAEEVVGGKGPIICSNAATAADFNVTFPAALPASTLPLRLSAAGDVTASAIDYSMVAAGMQVGYGRTATAASVAALADLPTDNTVPQVGEGTEVLSLAYTPKKIGNKVLVRATVPINVDGTVGARTAVKGVGALFKDGAANALTAQVIGLPYDTVNTILGSGVIVLSYEETVASLSAATWSVRAGQNSNAGEGSLCASCLPTLGTTAYRSIEITEIAQ